MEILKQYETININEICRICLIKKSGMIIIRESGIENVIISCTPIQLLEKDRSHFICTDCVKKIQNWFDFYKEILQSFKIGHLVIQQGKNQKQDGFGSDDSSRDIYLLPSKPNLEETFSSKKSIKVENNIDITEKVELLLSNECVDISFYENVKNLVTTMETREVPGEVRKFECEKCGKKFKQIQTLNDHIKRHYNLRNFACSLCGKTFYKQFNVLEHMRIHTGERPFKCEFCASTFTRALLLRNHIKKIHINDKTFVCEICEKSFVDNYQLKIHIRTHTGEKPYNCSQCEKAFALQGQLNSHIKYKHTKQKDYICNLCGRAFTAKHSLEEHLRVHTGKKREPKHSCSFCGKKCITTTQLKIHVKSRHTGERPFPCQICEKSFITRSALDCHLRTHTGEKSYFCGECGKAFSTNSTLKIHVRVHTGERPFRCNHCCKTFTQASTLNTHLKIHKELETSDK